MVVTTFSAFQEQVQHELLYLDVLQESLPMWVKNLHGRSLETMKRAAKPSELRVALMTAGSWN